MRIIAVKSLSANRTAIFQTDEQSCHSSHCREKWSSYILQLTVLKRFSQGLDSYQNVSCLRNITVRAS